MSNELTCAEAVERELVSKLRDLGTELSKEQCVLVHDYCFHIFCKGYMYGWIDFEDMERVYRGVIDG